MEIFVGIVLSIIIGFYLLGFLGRLFLRYWLNKKMKQFGQQGGAQFGGSFGGFNFGGAAFNGAQRESSDEQQANRPVGDIKISGSAEENKRISDKVGDYVDFEDVK